MKHKEQFIAFMKDKGIVTSQVHNRNDTHSCVQQFKTVLPNLDHLETELVCLPVGWWLTQEDLEYIVCQIQEWTLVSLNFSQKF